MRVAQSQADCKIDYEGYDTVKNKEEGEFNQTIQQMFQEKLEEMRQKIENGDTEQSFAIGSQSFTLKEWDRMLKKFDATEEAIVEAQRKEIARRTGQKYKPIEQSEDAEKAVMPEETM